MTSIKRKPNKKRVARVVIFSIIFVIIFGWATFLAISPSTNKKLTKIDKTYKDIVDFCYDDFDLFSDEQESMINHYCKTAQKKYKVTILVSTCSRVGGNATQIGTQFLSKNNFSSKENIFVLIINATNFNRNYHFDIYTYGSAANKISGDYKSGEVKKIIWCEGADKILTSNSETATQGVIDMTKTIGKAYAWILNDISWFIICGVSLVIGLIVAIIVINVIKKKYSKHREVSNYEFRTNTKLDLKVKQDVFLRKSVSSVIIATSSSSGGGGSFRGSGRSGGGGGGGHRGGR